MLSICAYLSFSLSALISISQLLLLTQFPPFSPQVKKKRKEKSEKMNKNLNSLLLLKNYYTLWDSSAKNEGGQVLKTPPSPDPYRKDRTKADGSETKKDKGKYKGKNKNNNNLNKAAVEKTTPGGGEGEDEKSRNKARCYSTSSGEEISKRASVGSFLLCLGCKFHG